MGKDAAPSFVQKPALDQSDDGQILIFTCKIAGSPQPDFKWSVDDKSIEDGGRYVTSVSNHFFFTIYKNSLQHVVQKLQENPPNNIILEKLYHIGEQSIKTKSSHHLEILWIFSREIAGENPQKYKP